MRRLGIDHGERRIGLALSDEDGRFAQPYETWERKDPKTLVHAVVELVREREVREIVIGLPLHLDGSEGASARRARRFAELVQAATDARVELWDERMTTTAASRVLGESGVRASEQKTVVDRVAAALMLQSYLDVRARSDVRSSASHEDDSSKDEEGDAWPHGADDLAPEPRGSRRRRGGRSRER